MRRALKSSSFNGSSKVLSLFLILSRDWWYSILTCKFLSFLFLQVVYFLCQHNRKKKTERHVQAYNGRRGTYFFRGLCYHELCVAVFVDFLLIFFWIPPMSRKALHLVFTNWSFWWKLDTKRQRGNQICLLIAPGPLTTWFMSVSLLCRSLLVQLSWKSEPPSWQ